MPLYNYVDTTTTQNIGGVKTFTSAVQLDAGSSSQSSPATFGAVNFASAGLAARFQFGDTSNALQNGNSAAMQLYSYHRLELSGGRRQGNPSFFTGTKKGIPLDNVSVMVDSAQDAQVVFGIQSNSATQSSNLFNTYDVNGNVLCSITPAGVIMPLQAATASAPTYVKGGMYFDTTLNKLRIGGATAWETVTSS